MKESTSCVIHMRKFISPEYMVHTEENANSFGCSCFKTFKKKLSLYGVFIIMEIAES